MCVHHIASCCFFKCFFDIFINFFGLNYSPRRRLEAKVTILCGKVLRNVKLSSRCKMSARSARRKRQPPPAPAAPAARKKRKGPAPGPKGGRKLRGKTTAQRNSKRRGAGKARPSSTAGSDAASTLRGDASAGAAATSAGTAVSGAIGIDTSVRFAERDLVWVRSDVSGACVAKIRRVPDAAGGLYRVNYYGTRSYDHVHGAHLQPFEVASVPATLDAQCDGDPEAYRSVYYALESLHRKKRLSVNDLPTRTWSVLNRYLNEEESSSSDSSCSDGESSDGKDGGGEDEEKDSKTNSSAPQNHYGAGSATTAKGSNRQRRGTRSSSSSSSSTAAVVSRRDSNGNLSASSSPTSSGSERSSCLGSSDDGSPESDSDATSLSSHSGHRRRPRRRRRRRRFRRFNSCLRDNQTVQKASSSFSTQGRTPRGGNVDRLRTLRPRYASPRPGTTARALYGVNDPEVLSALLEFDAKDDQSWLSGAFIDYIFGIFAKIYRKVKFLPTLFAAHELRRVDAGNLSSLCVSDVLGMPVDLSSVSQLVLCNNLNDNHWTMIRISVKPRRRELSLFEPMGLPQTRKSKSNAAAARRARAAGGRSRSGGGRLGVGVGSGSAVSTRNFPRRLLQWLESVWPTPRGALTWGELAHSAIKKRQQLTGFDCGVACLLYAEKCGMGMDRQHIARSTSQRHITAYRQVLSDLMGQVMQKKKTPRGRK